MFTVQDSEVVNGVEGFDVNDGRHSVSVAWRGRRESAEAIAIHLNHAYPNVAPSFDTVVHEITMRRIGGEEDEAEAKLTSI